MEGKGVILSLNLGFPAAWGGEAVGANTIINRILHNANIRKAIIEKKLALYLQYFLV